MWAKTTSADGFDLVFLIPVITNNSEGYIWQPERFLLSNKFGFFLLFFIQVFLPCRTVAVATSGIWKTPCSEWKEFCSLLVALFPRFALIVLRTAGALEFFLLFSERRPTITASHKQWGLLISEGARRESVRWERGGVVGMGGESVIAFGSCRAGSFSTEG